MSRQRDPVRMSAIGGDAPPDLAAGIRSLRAERGSPPQLQALQRRLEGQLAQPSYAGTDATTASLFPIQVLWLAGAAVIGLGVGIAVRDGGNHDRARTTMPTPPLPAAPATQAAAPAPAEEPAPPPEAEAPALAATPESGHAQRRHRVRASSARSHAGPSRPEAELELLERAQAMLDREPRGTLRLVEQHAREHRRGVFVQEREVLRVEAELKLGRKGPALRHAREFIERFPRSPHARRVQALLARHPPRNNPELQETPIE
ncbi:MAG: hypothetical protein OXT09_06940 [Myxococcales bacterium]|nr:hypothetical protein [Myxococcales bacterium]